MMFAVAGGVGAVGADVQLALVVQDAVQDVGGVAHGGADDAGGEVGVLVGDEPVVRQPAPATEVAGQGAGLVAVAADRATLAVAA